MPTKLENIAEAFKTFAYQSVKHSEDKRSENPPGKVMMMKGKRGFITLMIQDDPALASSLHAALLNTAEALETFVETNGSGAGFTAYSAHFQVFYNAIKNHEALHNEIAKSCTDNHYKGSIKKATAYMTQALNHSGEFDMSVPIPKKPQLNAPSTSFGGHKPVSTQLSPKSKPSCTIL
jgi:hypothetical protein